MTNDDSFLQKVYVRSATLEFINILPCLYKTYVSCWSSDIICCWWCSLETTQNSSSKYKIKNAVLREDASALSYVCKYGIKFIIFFLLVIVIAAKVMVLFFCTLALSILAFIHVCRLIDVSLTNNPILKTAMYIMLAHTHTHTPTYIYNHNACIYLHMYALGRFMHDFFWGFIRYILITCGGFI